MANRTAIEQQDGHLEAVLARQLGGGIDVDDGDRRQTLVAFQLGELVEHVLAEPAALAAQDHEACRQAHWLRGGEMPWVTGAGLAAVAFTCLAMNCTVFGGTSPTAVTWWPSTIVE